MNLLDFFVAKVLAFLAIGFITMKPSFGRKKKTSLKLTVRWLENPSNFDGIYKETWGFSWAMLVSGRVFFCYFFQAPKKEANPRQQRFLFVFGALGTETTQGFSFIPPGSMFHT